MSLPTATEVASMKYSTEGAPAVAYDPSNEDALSMRFSFEGSPVCFAPMSVVQNNRPQIWVCT